MTRYWLMKSEPTCFSMADLEKRSQQIEPWDGVRNYQARNFLQAMQLGDLAFFYHSSCPIPGIAGIISIVKRAYPDKTALDISNPHYDPKSTPDKPRWVCVDVQLIKKFKQTVSLAQLKRQSIFSSMRLLQKGNRLSVMPITAEEWQAILMLV